MIIKLVIFPYNFLIHSSEFLTELFLNSLSFFTTKSFHFQVFDIHRIANFASFHWAYRVYLMAQKVFANENCWSCFWCDLIFTLIFNSVKFQIFDDKFGESFWKNDFSLSWANENERWKVLKRKHFEFFYC